MARSIACRAGRTKHFAAWYIFEKACKIRLSEGMCSMLGQYNEAHPDETMLGFNKPKYYLCNDSTFQVILDLLTIYLGDFSDDMVWFRLFPG